jgi:hypothetical protein
MKLRMWLKMVTAIRYPARRTRIVLITKATRKWLVIG